MSEAFDLKQAYPYISIIPKPNANINCIYYLFMIPFLIHLLAVEMDKKKKLLDDKYAICRVNTVLGTIGTAEVKLVQTYCILHDGFS